ncbi:Nonribosomal peptide synthase atnA [Apiospora sp. TS-2023a]
MIPNAIASSRMIEFHHLDQAVLGEIGGLCHVEVSEIEDIYSCTPIQVGLLAHPNESSYDNTGVFSLAPGVDADRLCAAISEAIAAHPILRTRIVHCQLGLVQVVMKSTIRVERSSMDLEQALRIIKDTPMSPGAPLFMVRMLRDKLVLKLHHALSDWPTQEALFEDIALAYHGDAMKQRGSYKPFVEHCLSIDEAMAREFWASRFTGEPVAFPLTKPGYYADAKANFKKPLAITPSMYGVSLTHVPSYIEVALALTIASYTGADSVSFGYILSGRNCARGTLQSTMGPMIVPFPVQVNLAQTTSTLRDLIKERTRERREVTKNPALQYGLQGIRSVSGAALAASRFNTMLNVRSPIEEPSYPGLFEVDAEFEPHGAYCLTLVCFIESDSISVEVFHDLSVICEKQMDNILHQFEHILCTIMQSPLDTKTSELGMLNGHDFQAMKRWNEQMPDEAMAVCLHDHIDHVARQQPAAIALDGPDGVMTYEELSRNSWALAHELRDRGLPMKRQSHLCWRTVLKAGGVCVPIDPAYPLVQKEAQVSRCNAKLLMASPALMKSLVGISADVLPVDRTLTTASFRPGPLPNPAPPSQAAYILFTSGSTGAPKGVILEHRNLFISLNSFGQRLGWTQDLRMLQFASYVWGASLVESIGTLLHGGTVCIASEEERMSSLARFIDGKNVGCALLTPTVIKLLLPEQIPSLRSLISGGEPIDPESVRTWLSQVRLFNAWGQSETAVVSSVAEISADSQWPEAIGTPVGCGLWIVDERDTDKLIPIGAMGEVLVDGPSVARCYLDNQEKTMLTMIRRPRWAPEPNRNESGRMFRTGVLGRLLPDGSILYIGRIDSQVKLFGQRFELEEVERSVCSHRLVRAAFATVITTGKSNDKQLVTVLSLEDPDLPNETALLSFGSENQLKADKHLVQIREHLVSRLPSYMVPTSYLAVEKLPQTASSKIDRQAIVKWLSQEDTVQLALRRAPVTRSESLTTPESAIELVLRASWADVLGLSEDEIGRESNFVRLGGDSIVAMQVRTGCRARGLAISVLDLLRSENLAEAGRSSEWLREPTAEGPDEAAGQDRSPAAIPAFEDIDGHLASIGINPGNVECVLPVTPIQEGILFMQLTGRGGEYWEDFTLKLTPTGQSNHVDTEKLQKAWTVVCESEPVLRTVFTTCRLSKESAFQQVILKNVVPTVSCVSDGTEDWGDKEIVEAFRPPIFATSQPQVHLHLVKVSQRVVYATLYMNHALVDGRSLRLISRKLADAYRDPACINRGLDASKYMAVVYQRMEAAVDYWTSYIAGLRPCLLPTLQIRDADTTTKSYFSIPKRDTTAMQSLCREQGITMANLVQVAWSLVLWQCTGMESSAFGCLQSEGASFDGGSDALGLFVGMLICRFDLTSETPLTALLRRARGDSLQAQEYGGAPLGMVGDALGFGRKPFFNTAMTIVGYNPSAYFPDGEQELLKLEPLMSEDNPSEFPIVLVVVFEGNSVWTRIWYHDSQVSASFASDINDLFAGAIKSIVGNPEQTVGALGASHRTPQAPAQQSLPIIQSGAAKERVGDLEVDVPRVKRLRQLWADVLSIPMASIGANDSFFGLGGNSFQVMLLAAAARDASIKLTVASIYKCPTLMDMAAEMN